MSFTKEQVEQLLQPIKPGRVLRANDQSHVPAFDVAAHLTRIFGYGGWDTENLSYTLVAEDGDVRTRTKDGKTQTYKVWTVAYVASITLVVKNADGFAIAHWSNGAGGDAVNQPSRGDAHHLAMTTAISTALKRCAAFGLGDQFGLSLYNKGSQSALVKTSLVVPEGVVFATKPKDVQENSQTPQSLGNDEREGQQPDDNSPSAATGSQQGSETDTGQSRGQSEQRELTALQLEVRSHPAYSKMDSSDRGIFLFDQVGYAVKSIKDLSDADCEQILAILRTK